MAQLGRKDNLFTVSFLFSFISLFLFIFFSFSFCFCFQVQESLCLFLLSNLDNPSDFWFSVKGKHVQYGFYRKLCLTQHDFRFFCLQRQPLPKESLHKRIIFSDKNKLPWLFDIKFRFHGELFFFFNFCLWLCSPQRCFLGKSQKR